MEIKYTTTDGVEHLDHAVLSDVFNLDADYSELASNISGIPVTDPRRKNCESCQRSVLNRWLVCLGEFVASKGVVPDSFVTVCGMCKRAAEKDGYAILLESEQRVLQFPTDRWVS